MIKILDFKKVYSDKTTVTYDRIDFMSNGLFHFKGENGTGKSTFFNCISGTDSDYEAKIIMNNEEISKSSLANQVCYMRQEVHLIEKLTGYQQLLIMHKIEEVEYLESFIREILVKLDLDKIIKNSISTFSVGQKRKLEFIRVLITQKRILILDEPFSQIDKNSIESMISLLQSMSFSKLIIYSNHETISSTTSFATPISLKRKSSLFWLMGFILNKSFTLMLISSTILIFGSVLFLYYSTVNDFNRSAIINRFYNSIEYGIFNSNQIESNAQYLDELYSSISDSGYESYHTTILFTNKINSLPLLEGSYPSSTNEILIGYYQMESMVNDYQYEQSDIINKWITIDNNIYQITGIVASPIVNDLFTNEYEKEVFLSSYPMFYGFNESHDETANNINLFISSDIQNMTVEDKKIYGSFNVLFNNELSINESINPMIIYSSIVILSIIAYFISLERTKLNQGLLSSLYGLGVNKNRIIIYTLLPELMLLSISYFISHLIADYFIDTQNKVVMKTFFIQIDPFSVNQVTFLFMIIPFSIAATSFFIFQLRIFSEREASS